MSALGLMRRPAVVAAILCGIASAALAQSQGSQSGPQGALVGKTGTQADVFGDSDGQGNGNGLVVESHGYGFDGNAWNRWRDNFDAGSVVTPGTSSQNGADQTNLNGRGVICVVNITAFTGTSITFTIQGKDQTNGLYYTLLASAAQAATTATPLVLTVYPGAAAAANVTASLPVPRTWRMITTDSAVTAITATTDCNVIN
jgi:hypothetical protein